MTDRGCGVAKGWVDLHVIVDAPAQADGEGAGHEDGSDAWEADGYVREEEVLRFVDSIGVGWVEGWMWVGGFDNDVVRI